MNKFFGVGYLVADLEKREVGDKIVANGAIAINRKYTQDKTDFINISIWGSAAEIALQYTSKGTMLAISGELQIEKKNDKIYTRVNVEDFKFFSPKKDKLTHSLENKQLETEELDFDLSEIFKNDNDLPF
jgi:single-strand DNA-binding protein